MDKSEDKTQSPVEIILLVAPCAFEIFASASATSLLFDKLPYSIVSKWSRILQFIIEFIVIVLHVIINFTILANVEGHIHRIVILIFELIFVICVVLSTHILYLRDLFIRAKKQITENERQSFMTNSRSAVNLLSVVSILAVDFEIYPVRFSKTAEYGFSLMDVGVGLFVFSNGIVAPELRRPVNTISKSILSSIPLIILGGLRLFLTRSVDYNVNEEEYGVHWNFFITLAVTKILSSIILNVINVKYSLHISLFVLALYELLLKIGLSEWVLSDTPRTNFINSNREGIVSSLGYVGLYFLSLSFGKLFIPKYNKNANKLTVTILLIKLSAILLLLTFITEKCFGVSRRLANMGYCFWILFIGIFMNLLFLSVDIILTTFYSKIKFKQKISRSLIIYRPFIIESINYNGLPFFLLANILTGLVNITVETEDVNTYMSLLILIVYMLINCIFVTVLYVKKIKLTSYLTG